MKYLIFLFGLIAFITSCDKQGINDFSTDVEEVSSEDRKFSDDLAVALGILEEGDKLQVSVGDNGIEYKIIDKRIAQNQVTFREERCRGNGLSFAKCVKAAVDEYGCQQITISGDVYVSSDCP